MPNALRQVRNGMAKPAFLIAASLVLAGCGSHARQSAVPPTPEEAKQAIADMYGDSIAAKMANDRVQLGTCIRTPVQYAPAPSQYSCTFVLLSPGGSSESRADFIPVREGWRAEPSLTETELPFPDPALHRQATP